MLPYLNNFISKLKNTHYSDETIYNYERDLRTFTDFLRKNNIEFKELNKKILANYKGYLGSPERRTAKRKQSQKVLSAYSINRMLSSIKAYLNHLLEINYNLPILPESVKLIKTGRKFTEAPKLEELIQLVESPIHLEKNKLVGLRNRTMLEVIFSTGIRISELLNLKRSQIDASGRIITIRHENKGERFVYLTPRALKWLEKYLGTRNDTLPYLFIPYRGRNNRDKNKKISPNYLQGKIKRYRELLGINLPISAHSLRHAFATYLAEKGANPAAIQILLGHESLATTTRYVSASDKYAEKIHRKFHPLKE